MPQLDFGVKHPPTEKALANVSSDFIAGGSAKFVMRVVRFV